MLKQLIVIAAGFTAACGNDHATPDAVAAPPTLTAIRNDIFDKSCAFGSCHSGGMPPAHLQLADDSVCHSLVLHTSCEFPTKMLVAPGNPDQSFLLDKMRGTASGTPAPDCANTNEQMPLGATPLTAEQIAQVQDWIQAGANCDGTVVDAGVDAPMIDVPPGPPAAVVTIAATTTTLAAGDDTQVTVTLEHGAPAGGQTIDLDVADATVLGVPSVLHVDEGLASIAFDVVAKRPAHPVRLTATAGGASKSVSIGVTGLALAELFYDPVGVDDGLEWIKLSNATGVPIALAPYTIGAGRTGYTYSLAQLAGTIPAHGCFIIGGPTSSAANGAPVFGQTFNFEPDLPNGSGSNGQASAYGLFDAVITQMTPASVPIDAVLCGQNNLAGLVGVDGLPATPNCPDIAQPGHSQARTDATTWVDQATPTPNNCTPISL